MIDGITINYTIKDFAAWQRAVNLSFAQTVGSFGDSDLKVKKRENTITTTHEGKFETYDLKLKEVENITTGKTAHYLTIKGSLHKNHFGGHNHEPFTFEQLQTQIKHLCDSLCIAPQTARISNIEVGLNVCTPFNAYDFIFNDLVCFDNSPFNRYDKDKVLKKSLGKKCENPAQYDIKIYDKGLQHRLPNELLRVEKKITTMQGLNNLREIETLPIKYLSDLQNYEKVYNLWNVFPEMWPKVLVCDIPDTSNLSKKNRIKLKDWRNPEYWKTLDSKGRKYPKETFTDCLNKHGEGKHRIIFDLLKNEWERLFKIPPFLASGENDNSPIPIIKIKDKIGGKYCKGCGKELHPEQSPRSVFCSAKYVGDKQAHKCRNMNSNPRNNRERKIKRIESRGTLFDVRQYLRPGKTG